MCDPTVIFDWLKSLFDISSIENVVQKMLSKYWFIKPFFYRQLKSYVGEGRCFCVNSVGKAREQATEVLQMLNIKVTPKDVFSRCQVSQRDTEWVNAFNFHSSPHPP